MYLEKEALDYFRNDDVLKGFLFHLHSSHTGEIPSRRLGRNYEFEQYRPYVPGDDLRDIDWKVYARSDRLFIKNYGMDTNADVRIILDVSLSMNYPKGAFSKLETAKKITAIFSNLLLNKSNRVRLSLLNAEYSDLGQINASNLQNILEDVRPAGNTDPFKVPEHGKEVVFLISDASWGEDRFRAAVEHLVRSRVNLVHIVPNEEIDLSLKGDLDLQDQEKGSKINIIPPRLREQYRALFRERTGTLKGRFLENGLLYGLFDLNCKYYVSLKSFLETFTKRHRRNSL